MENLLAGVIAAGWLVAGLYFFRFWRRTHDRFFLLFAISFWIECADRVAIALVPFASENEPLFYVPRLLAYGLILLAIWRKNRERR